MDIRFTNSKLQKVLCSEKEIIRQYGQKNGRKIKNRMAVLRSAPTLAQVPTSPPFRCHLLRDDLRGCFAVVIEHPFRLIFRPANNPVPKKDDGGIDLAAVTAIEILDVRDYH